jgi:RNA polymerase sigma-70 factor (ECF subfamily)
VEDLADWLGRAHRQAFRTACLILRNRADAEEAVQDAFLRAWRFRASLPDTEEGLRPYLYRVVVNACLTKLRTEAHERNTVGDDALETLPSPEPGPEAESEASDVARAMLRALADLPEHLRVTVVLRYYTGLSEKEIATAIKRRPGTVKSRLNEARGRLAHDPTLQALRAPYEEAR